MIDLALVRRRGLRSGASLLVLAWVGMSAPAFAETNEGAVQPQSTGVGAPGSNTSTKASPEKDTIIVTGVRSALATAQTIKKNAPTVVDSVTATDIGAFPDQSAADALQRVPGISVNRLQSADDSTHPSGEPTQVLIRGLPFVSTEFNGRDSFSADSARGLQFNDVSPELLAGVDAYKNQTADMIEGGIAGTVNLRTRLPFDQKRTGRRRQRQVRLWRAVREMDSRILRAGQRYFGHRSMAASACSPIMPGAMSSRAPRA